MVSEEKQQAGSGRARGKWPRWRVRVARRSKHALPSLYRVLRYFSPHIVRQRGLVIRSLAALFVAIVFRLLEPWPLKFVIDRVIVPKAPARWERALGLDTLSPTLWLAVAALSVVLITLARAAADYASRVGFFVIGNRVVIQLRDQVYRHLHTLSLAYHHQARTGDLIIRVTRDVSLLRDVTATAILPLLASVMILAGMVVVMFLLEWRLALMALSTVPLFSITTMRIGRRIRESARKQRKREGAMAATAAESIGAIENVQALSLEGLFAESFAQRNRTSQKEDLKANRLSARLGRTIDVLLSVATALVLWYGAQLVLWGAMTPGALLVFLTYVKRAFKPAQSFAKYTARLAKAAAAGERVIELLEQAPDIGDQLGARPAPPLRGEVRFENVGFSYDARKRVLRDISFQVKPGCHVALVGPSGIGKSTLVRLIGRLFDPTEGRILIDGIDIRTCTIASLRAQISVVLQDSILFSASVRENIACGDTTVTQTQIEAAARLANAHTFIQRMVEGYETVLGERGTTLSRGQRQRIAIARAAVRDVPLLILDEPTAGLDEENERAVTEALLRLARDRTTFLVTHNLALAARMDLILYLDRGRLLELGPHEQLLASEGPYATNYRTQTAHWQ